MIRNFQKTIFALLVLTLAAACAPATTGDEELRPTAGKIFRHRWWNHYSRALDAADQQDYPAARADLLAAVAQRHKDQRMARTYGMHFVDYFPHRELGVIHWLGGNLEDARMELQKSIQDTPSAKARYYLDKVRKVMIEQRGGEIPPPNLTLDVSAAEFRTRDQPVRLKGHARDPNFVARLSVAGEVIHMQGARVEIAFDHPLNLHPGRHAISVEATNLSGLSTRREVVIHVDRQGPWIVLAPLLMEDGRWRLLGTLHDPSGVAALLLDGRAVSIDPGPRSAFSIDGTHLDNILRLRAQDRLGNTTAIDLPVAALVAAQHKALWVAGLQTGVDLVGLAGGRDDQPPVMHIEEWQDHQTVYMDQVVITGSVRDRHKVTDLLINGVSVLPTPGPMVIFSHFVPLQEGLNRITLESRDAFDNAMVHQLTIVRKVPRALLLSARLRMGVFPFDQAGDVSAASFAFQDNFIFQLLQRRRFQIVERHLLEQILQEQKLNRTRLIDSATALQLGRLAAAQAIVAGSIVETHTGIEIVGRVVDTETGEVLAATDVYGEVKSLTGFKDLARALSLKIHREFPLVNGTVLEKAGETIFTDLGADEMRAQRRLLVYHDHTIALSGGDVRQAVDHQMLGSARVIQLDEKMSKARLLQGADPAIAALDKVIAQ